MPFPINTLRSAGVLSPAETKDHARGQHSLTTHCDRVYLRLRRRVGLRFFSGLDAYR